MLCDCSGWWFLTLRFNWAFKILIYTGWFGLEGTLNLIQSTLPEAGTLWTFSCHFSNTNQAWLRVFLMWTRIPCQRGWCCSLFFRPWPWMHCPWSSSSPRTPFSPSPAPSSSSSQQWPVPCPRPPLCCRARGCRGAPSCPLCLSRYLPASPSHLQGARASPPWGLTSTRWVWGKAGDVQGGLGNQPRDHQSLMGEWRKLENGFGSMHLGMFSRGKKYIKFLSQVWLDPA